MLLSEYEKAIADLKDVCPDYVIIRIVPATVAIWFYTRHRTRILWTKQGDITEFNKNGIVIKHLREI